jgi:hypothetical protein
LYNLEAAAHWSRVVTNALTFMTFRKRKRAVYSCYRMIKLRFFDSTERGEQVTRISG